MHETRQSAVVPWFQAVPLMLVGIVLFLPNLAVAEISGTPHDFSTQGWSGGRLCSVCHTPFNAQDVQTPRWDDNLPTRTFQMYSSSTLDMKIAGAPQGVSLPCLSCHDGATAMDVFTGKAGNAETTDTGFSGSGLREDHPISVTYNPTRSRGFNPASYVVVESLKLFGESADQVECASCHDPHDASNGPFLRRGNAGSNLCLVCHAT